MKIRLTCFVAFFFLIAARAHTEEARSHEAGPYIDFKSPEGIKRLTESQYKTAFFYLANNFEPQEVSQYGGAATAVVVMNTLRGADSKKPKPVDDSRLTPDEKAVIEKGYQPFFARYTQRNIFVAGIKDKLEVLGKPVATVTGSTKDVGVQLRQLHELFLAHHFKSEIHIADDKLTEENLRSHFKKRLSGHAEFIVANYRRAEMGQNKTNGHISPVAAYDEKSDSFLIMDVNPNISHWGWVKTTDFLKAMRTFDTKENRGYLLVSDEN